MNNNIALADIRAFVTIARCGSFTQAAEELGASRAHLSRQLNQLENRLGVQLLIRTTRTQRLTEAGEHFFEECEKSLFGIDQAITNVMAETSRLSGSIAINCVGGPVGEEVVAPIIGDFLKQYSEISIDLDFSSQRVDLVGDGFDLIIRMGALDDSRFIAKKLCELPVSTLASPDYLKQHGQPEHPKDLKDHNCLTGTVKRWSFRHKDNVRQKLDLPVNGNFSCKNGRAMTDGALSGNGIVRLPTFYCDKEIKSGLLVEVFENWEIASIPIYLLYHRKKFLPERLKILLPFISEQFESRVKKKTR